MVSLCGRLWQVAVCVVKLYTVNIATAFGRIPPPCNVVDIVGIVTLTCTVVELVVAAAWPVFVVVVTVVVAVVVTVVVTTA